MSPNFAKIKKYNDKGYYTTYHIKVFCRKGVITPEEFTLITGLTY